MRQESPCLVKVLRARPDVVATRDDPDKPTGFLRCEIARYASSVCSLVRASGHIKSELRQHYREHVDRRRVARVLCLVAAAIQRALETAAARCAVLVVVDFQYELVGVPFEVSRSERAGGRCQGRASHNWRDICVEVQAREEDKQVRVGRVDRARTLLDVGVPVTPVVRRTLERRVVVWRAELVTQRH